MTSTLFRHELLRTWRWILIAILAAVMVVGISVGGSLVFGGPIRTLLSTISLIVSIGFMYAMPLLISLDFYRSCYSKTGYFTASIPARSTTIYLVKAAYAYVVTLVGFLIGAGLTVAALVASGAAQGVSPRETMKGLLDGLSVVTSLPAGVLIVMVLALLLFPVVAIAPYFFAATVGSEAWISRSGFGGVVLVWFLYYLGSQIVTMVSIFIPPSLDLLALPELKLDFSPLALVQSGNDVSLLPIALIVVVFVMPIVAMWWAKVSYARRLELR